MLFFRCGSMISTLSFFFLILPSLCFSFGSRLSDCDLQGEEEREGQQLKDGIDY